MESREAGIRGIRTLATLAVRDTAARLSGRGRGGGTGGVWAEGIDAGIQWLCRTHDVTGRRGCSKGYNLVLGWRPAFAETTGYIMGTLLAYGRRTGSNEYATRAREMGDWEIEIQNEDGGVIEGLHTGQPSPSNVFNTGMVIHGWLDYAAYEPADTYLDAAVRAGRWLVSNQDTDGAWRGAIEYQGIPHTYNARVAWALLRLADATGEETFGLAGERHLDWVLKQQKSDGWFDNCVFKPGMNPSTHGLAYTCRGLLEGAALRDRQDWLDASIRTSRALIAVLERDHRLPGAFRPGWQGVFHECLTGTAQLGGVWMRLFQLTAIEEFKRAGVTATELAASRQMRTDWPPVRGALAGSFPIYGRYAPVQFPNWATKFLVDALVAREELLREAPASAPEGAPDVEAGNGKEASSH